MAENRLPNPRGYRIARSAGASYPTDRDRADKARQAAEALFAPRPKPTIPEAVAAPAEAGREKRSSNALSAASGPMTSGATDSAAAVTAPQAKEPIPSAHVARMRTWLRYGMSLAEVAAVYGVPIAEIERLLEQA
jgi:hypothetical protein